MSPWTLLATQFLPLMLQSFASGRTQPFGGSPYGYNPASAYGGLSSTTPSSSSGGSSYLNFLLGGLGAGGLGAANFLGSQASYQPQFIPTGPHNRGYFVMPDGSVRRAPEEIIARAAAMGSKAKMEEARRVSLVDAKIARQKALLEGRSALKLRRLQLRRDFKAAKRLSPWERIAAGVAA